MKPHGLAGNFYNELVVCLGPKDNRDLYENPALMKGKT